MDDVKKQAQAIQDDIKHYKKLDAINTSPEFDEFFNLQIETAAKKMLACFTGAGPANWEEFCKLRGEVVAYLYPIQEIRGTKAMIQTLTEQLNTYYNKQI